MKITHLFHHYAPVVGGMEKVVQNIAEEHAKMGHDVHILTSIFGAEQESKEEILNKVSIKRLKAFQLHYPDLTFPLERADKLLKESDIVHAHSQKSFFNHILSLRAKKLGTPLLMDFISVDYLETHRNIFVRGFGSCYQNVLEQRSINFVDTPITLNRRDYLKLQQKFGVTSLIVPNGLEKIFFTRPRDEDLFRAKRDVNCEKLFACI
ncbi:MAG: glycosyltransferase family 4 protein, partial [Candidatus Korarchaeota archaeon]|nr:glycosyltransferase family 4 protein [Candidatus Korarchaeota archaeon]NIU84398.1 glycosyltransferase [Candidatus Thorarchaeota archaeon]NIW14506.1 glycosyltransferase [Candidatus Thorarchaeota archaeon]NIW52586.1 glycosyltransferase [Candidatus Korarchaeota archaeon]